MAINTEYSAPAVKHPVLHRKNFIDSFKFAISKPLTVITAPAGYGKTTACISALSTIQNLRYLWITLTNKQNDAHHFVNSLLNTFGSISDLRLNYDAKNLVASEANNASQRVESLLQLLDEALIGTTSPIVIILDDYHKIHNEEVHRILSSWIDESPVSIRTVLLSRTRPSLSEKYRGMSGVCTYLNQDHCKFDLQETCQFFLESMHLNLDQDYILQVHNQSQGWPLGIQLIAIHLRLSQNTAFPSVDPKDISNITSEFFRFNIYEMLSSEIKNALTAICDLTSFSADLLDFIFGNDSGAALIRELENRNLFIFNSGEGQNWHRFHDLFKEFLQEQAGAIDSDTLRKAADWFFAQEDFYTEIYYLLKASLFHEAAKCIEKIGPEVYRRGEIETLNRWIQALPNDSKSKRPKLLILECWCIPDVEKPLICPLILDQVGKLLLLDEDKINIDTDKNNQHRPEDFEQIYVDYLMMRAFISTISVDTAQSLKFGLLAHKLIEDNALSGIARCNLTLGQNYYLLGDHQRAIFYLEQAIQYSKYEDHPYVMIVALCYLILIYQISGKLNSAINVAQESVSWLDNNGFATLPMTTVARVILCDIFFEKNELVVSAQMHRDALEYCKGNVPALQKTFAEVANFRQLYSLKEYEKSEAAVEKIIALTPRVDALKSNNIWTFGTPSTEALKASIYMATGRIEETRIWLESVKQNLTANTAFVYEKERLILVKAFLVCGQREDALTLCHSIKHEAQSNHRILHVVQCLIIEAVIHFSSGEIVLAQELIKEALITGVDCGFRRVFLDAEVILKPLLERALNTPETRPYVEKLWASKLVNNEEPEQSKEKLLLNLLSRRETSVIVLLADGDSNKEIARKLNISSETVKQAVKGILKKMAVRNRTEAALIYRSSLTVATASKSETSLLDVQTTP